MLLLSYHRPLISTEGVDALPLSPACCTSTFLLKPRTVKLKKHSFKQFESLRSSPLLLQLVAVAASTLDASEGLYAPDALKCFLFLTQTVTARKHPFLFFWLRSIFRIFTLLTNAPVSHDGCAEPTSCLKGVYTQNFLCFFSFESWWGQDLHHWRTSPSFPSSERAVKTFTLILFPCSCRLFVY